MSGPQPPAPADARAPDDQAGGAWHFRRPGVLAFLLAAGAWLSYILAGEAIEALMPDLSGWSSRDIWAEDARLEDIRATIRGFVTLAYLAAAWGLYRVWAAPGRTTANDTAVLHVGFLAAGVLAGLAATDLAAALVDGRDAPLEMAVALMAFLAVAMGWGIAAEASAPARTSDFRTVRDALVVVGVVLGLLSIPIFGLAMLGLAYKSGYGPEGAFLGWVVFLVPVAYGFAARAWLRSLLRRSAHDPGLRERVTRGGNLVGLVLTLLLVGTMALVMTCFAVVEL